MKKYIVKLSKRERERLEEMISTGKSSARKLSHARILLKADSGKHGDHWKDKQISEAFDVDVRTVERIRERFVTEGLEVALVRRQHKRYKPLKLDGRQESQLVQLACSQAPEGRKRWTVGLLTSEYVRLGYVDSISKEAVRQRLKKRKLNLG